MRILLTAKHPPGGSYKFGGVQSWISTVAAEFGLRGVYCEIWGPEFPFLEGSFDACIVANSQDPRSISDRVKISKTIAISHGIIDAERPAPAEVAAFTSEEVRDHWGRDGEILRQPIDLEFWSPSQDERNLLLFYSYRAQADIGLINLADRLGLQFLWIKNASPSVVRAAMRRAALVCASGRAALEAMAVGAPTMIFDWRPYNGSALLDPDLEHARRANYSGRGGINPFLDQAEEIARSTMTTGSMRHYVCEHHDARLIADQVLTLCS